MRIKSKVFLLFAALFLVVLSSCDEGEVYSRFYHIENGKWSRDSLLTFTIDSLNHTPGVSYDVTLELTTNRSFPYRDLWLQIDHNMTDTLVHSDTLRFILADEYGKWLGSGVGGLNQITFPYISFMVGDSVKNKQLTIRHVMKDEWLRGIEKIGVKIIQANGVN